MATLKDLKEVVKTAALAQASVKKFIFDDLSAIDGQLDKDVWQLVLMKPPLYTIPRARQQLEYRHYAMDVFLFDLFDERDKLGEDDLLDAWSAQTIVGDQILDALRQLGNEFQLLDSFTSPAVPISVSLGHFEHNNQLLGVRFLFTMRVHHCINP